MRKKVLRILAVLLVFSICTSLLPSSVFAVTVEEPVEETTPTMVDFIAGNVTAEDIYGVLDASIVPAAIDYNEAVEKNHIARCYEDEGTDLNKIIFLNIDGTKTMYTFDFPVKYVDGNGNIQDIRLEIANSTVNAGEFETAANNTVTTFSAQFTDGIVLEGNDTEIRLIPILPAPDLSATLSTTDMAATTATAQRIDANTVAYPYDAKTTVEYSLTYTGFKEDIVVSEYTGQTEYPFRLLTNGLALEEIGGSFFLVDAEGNIEASIGDIIIFTADERNNAFGDIESNTIIENQEYLLNIVVDAEYLADPATTYPIRIDPTVKINYNYGAGAVEDITISTNTNYSGSYDYLFVGRRQTEGIARILLRFPGLDVSQLAGATVTDAHVRIRDMMCEDVPLDVSCHIFTGNEWAESSATWANCNPNNYVTTPLSTNTLKWSIGNTFSNKHWYQFDVTEAVQGWVDGNYNPSKGFLFKVANTVENGNIIQNRTFGSYNRTNYRPSLTVTYEFGTQWVANDTYYLNNQGRGKFIQLNASGVDTVVSGLLSELGNSIQWQIQKVGNGYVIRSATDTTKYLSGAALQSDSSVNITPVIDAAIPDICLWSITPASAGGCMIRNLANGRYLASAGTYLYTSTNTDTHGSAMYENFVWRLAPLWYYGNTAEHDRQELSSGFDIKDVVVNIGETVAVDIDEVPNNALWTNASDFTFSHTSGTYGLVSITSLDNTFSGFTTGIATYTATHKVTGRTTTFKVYVDRYTYELTNEFQFNDSDALRIRGFYWVVDNRIATEGITYTPIQRAWIYARLLGGIIYDHQEFYKQILWKQIAGDMDGSEEWLFRDYLGYSQTEYELLRNAIRQNSSDANLYRDRSDFAHMQISMAARLAYQANLDGLLSNIGGVFFGEDVPYLGGWLGDAVLDRPTSFGNDDYHADLDAENLFRLILSGQSTIDAINGYYASLTSTRTRADIFLGYIDYETVVSKISDYLSDNEEEIKATNPETYNFMKSLQARLPDIYNFAAE